MAENKRKAQNALPQLDRDFVEDLMQTAHKAAWHGGQIILEHALQPRSVRMKGPRDPVTQTDTAVQHAIIEIIHRRHPDHAILAEEDPLARPDSNGGWYIPEGVVWIVDPVDGTNNYIAGMPQVCVSIGAVVDGIPVAGAIYDPFGREVFLGASGLGASLNGRPLEHLKPKALDEAIVGTDWAHDFQSREFTLRVMDKLYPVIRSVRLLGAGALGLAYTAAGRLNCYCNHGLQPWDSTAGVAIITEVGGVMRRPDGSAWEVAEPALFTGHPEVVAEILRIVNGK
jgi:myo-inositol-1(or 4)-monophosphatase